MTTMNGFKIDNINNMSLKIQGLSIVDKNSLRKYLNEISVKTEELIGNVIEIPDNHNFTITINTYRDIVLVVVEDNNKNKCYYLFDEEVRYLKVTNNENEVELKIGNKLITNSSLDDCVNTSILVHFVNYLHELQKTISFDLDKTILCSNLCIFDEENSKIITENKEFILAQPNFYADDVHKMRFMIISKMGLRVIGSLECYLNDKNESNFNYRGNLSFNIHKRYLNMGYERKVLGLLKSYIDEYSENINKTLYIAGEEDNELIPSIAISNGGSLVYEGVVPKSDPLYFMGKVKRVRVYRIG